MRLLLAPFRVLLWPVLAPYRAVRRRSARKHRLRVSLADVGEWQPVSRPESAASLFEADPVFRERSRGLSSRLVRPGRAVRPPVDRRALPRIEDAAPGFQLIYFGLDQSWTDNSGWMPPPLPRKMPRKGS